MANRFRAGDDEQTIKQLVEELLAILPNLYVEFGEYTDSYESNFGSKFYHPVTLATIELSDEELAMVRLCHNDFDNDWMPN